MRTIKIIKIADGLYRSEDQSVALHLAHRTWEKPNRRWYASWNTFMSGRVERYAATKSAVLADFGAKVRTV